MNNMTSDQGSAALRKYVSQNDVARRLFDSFAQRKKDAQETTVDRAAVLSNADYSSMLAVFKELHQLGLGHFIPGRHGYPSRIEWHYSIKSLAEIARGESQEPREVAVDADQVDSEHETSTLKHEFQLRDGLKIKFELPSDLNEKEADRLANFIKTLPF